MEKPKIEPYYSSQPINNFTAPLRKKKLEITTGNKVISLKKQSYNQNNPYALPNEPRTPNNNSKEGTYVRDTLT